MRARGGNGLCDDGDGDGLRLLEGRRKACDARYGNREPASQFGAGQGSGEECHSANTEKSGLAVPWRASKRDTYGSKDLAQKNGHRTAAAFEEVRMNRL